jgi:hydroxyacylglutathione hydrolase
MKMLEILLLPVLNDNYIYLIHEPNSGNTAVVDPAVAQPVLDALTKKGWQLTHIFNTHHHWDHVGGNLELKQQTACKIIGATHDQHRIPGIDITVNEGDKIALGTEQAIILETPGHTAGHIVYYFANEPALFCGDTLFVMGCGRLFEGTAQQMWDSLQKLLSLPGHTRIYCAHEYTQTNGQFALSIEPDNIDLQKKMRQVNELRAKNQPTIPSTIAQELLTNPFFRANNLALQENLKLAGHPPVEVFAKTRALKDSF